LKIFRLHPHPFISIGDNNRPPAPGEAQVKKDAGYVAGTSVRAEELTTSPMRVEVFKRSWTMSGSVTGTGKGEWKETEKEKVVGKDNILTYNIVKKRKEEKSERREIFEGPAAGSDRDLGRRDI
jgi:hypothetical protein